MQLPAHIQNALTAAGGRRLNGDPNYKFAWSGDFTYQISNGKSYEPFRVVAEDCWLLVKYELPDFWGSKEDWEINNWKMGSVTDNATGIALIEPLYTAGPYPAQGRYRNIMRIRRKVTLTDGETYLEHCAPTLQWVSEFFPGVRDFLELSTEEKSKYLANKDKSEKAALAKSFADSRENYRGIATSKQIKDKVEKLERFVNDPVRVQKALRMPRRRMK